MRELQHMVDLFIYIVVLDLLKIYYKHLKFNICGGVSSETNSYDGPHGTKYKYLNKPQSLFYLCFYSNQCIFTGQFWFVVFHNLAKLQM